MAEGFRLFCKVIAWTAIGVGSFALLAYASLMARDATIELVKVLAWPLTVVLLALLFALNSQFKGIFVSVFSLVKKVSVAGVDIELNTESAAHLRTELNATFVNVAEAAKREYDQVAYAHSIPERLRALLDNDLATVFLQRGLILKNMKLRATVHVPDIVFKEYLYQLIDYVPKGGGIGRRFPQRYGMIGRSWRLRKSVGDFNTFDETDEVEKDKEETLIKHWGMTREDAATRDWSRASCFSILLYGARNKDLPVGILYVDSENVGDLKFGTRKESDEVANQLAKTIETAPRVQELGEVIEEIMKSLFTKAPSLDPAKPQKS